MIVDICICIPRRQFRETVQAESRCGHRWHRRVNMTMIDVRFINEDGSLSAMIRNSCKEKDWRTQ